MTAIHGISHEQAMDVGISEAEALEGFLAINGRAAAARRTTSASTTVSLASR